MRLLCTGTKPFATWVALAGWTEVLAQGEAGMFVFESLTIEDESEERTAAGGGTVVWDIWGAAFSFKIFVLLVVLKMMNNIYWKFSNHFWKLSADKDVMLSALVGEAANVHSCHSFEPSKSTFVHGFWSVKD